MLSEDTLRLYRNVFSICARTHCLGPLQWNAVHNKLELLPKLVCVWSSRARKLKLSREQVLFLRHYASAALELVATIILIICYGDFAVTNRHNFKKFFQASQIILAFMISGLASARFCHSYALEIIQLANTTLATNEQLRHEYKEEFKACPKKDRVFNRFCRTYIVLIPILILNTVGSLLLPARTASESLNLYTFWGGTNFAGRLAFAMIMGCLIYKRVMRFMFLWFLIFAPVFVLREWLTLIKNRIRARNSGHVYQSLQIFHIVIRECFSPALLPMLLFANCFFLIVVYTAIILFHNELVLPQIVHFILLVLVITFAISLMFGIMKSILKSSTAIVGELGKRKSGNWSRTPLRPIRFWFGSLFHAQTGTGLTALQLSAEQVASLVIMFKPK